MFPDGQEVDVPCQSVAPIPPKKNDKVLLKHTSNFLLQFKSEAD